VSDPTQPIDVGEFVLHGTPASGPHHGGDPLLRRRFAKLAANVAAISTVLAVVIAGGGAVVAYRTLSGGGPQPEKYAPASTFAFAKVDLDPSAGEKVAIYRFARKFPSSVTKKLKNADDFRDRLLRMVFKNSAQPDINYDKDIKPWLGERAGIAGFIDASNDPQALGIIAVSDVRKARTSLARIRTNSSSFAYDVKSDFALITDGQAVLNAAEDQIAKNTLAKTKQFRSDMQVLGGGRVVTAWADLAQVGKVSGSLFKDLFGSVLGGGITVPGGPVVPLQPNLPSPSPACLHEFQQLLAHNTGQQAINKLSTKCKREFGLTQTQTQIAGDAEPRAFAQTATAAAPTPATPKASGRIALGVHLNSDYAELVMHVFGKHPTTQLASVHDQVAALPKDTVAVVASSGIADLHKQFDAGDPQVKTDLANSLESAGLDVTVDDLLNGLGASVLVALGNVPDHAHQPLIALRTKPSDASAAKRDVSQINDAFARNNDATRLISRNAHGDLVVSNSASYADSVVKGGGLGGQKRFKKAVGPMSGTVVALGYVDLRRILSTQPDHGGAGRALTAAGFSVVGSGDDYTLRVRVVAD
jgi:hypothetical protein